jgi:hypothetical protein
MAKRKTQAFTDADYVIHETAGAFESRVAEEPLPVANNFVIEEHDIPKRSGRKGTLTYPIADLKSGSKQSFLVPTTPENIKNVTSSIRTFAFRHDLKVTLRAEATGVRVWRKAPKA